MTPVVSVAVITYNQEDLLPLCLDSVLAQDFDGVEIVVADDCSTDGTRDVLRDYARRFPDIVRPVFAEENQGVTANSNRAHFACRGRYICWTGGDDEFLPGKLAAQVAFMDRHPETAISYHDVEVFEWPGGRVIGGFLDDAWAPGEAGPSDLIEHGCFMPAVSVMLRRDCAPEHGFDERIHTSSDWLFWIETSLNGPIRKLDGVWSRYRRHAGNVTRKTHDYTELVQTLQIAAERHSELQPLVRQPLARILVARGGHRLRRRRFGEALVDFKEARSLAGSVATAKVFGEMAANHIQRRLKRG